jgi:hypothetical protein
MSSNSYTPLALDLYRTFRIDIVQATRAINSKGDARGAVKEVIVRNYTDSTNSSPLPDWMIDGEQGAPTQEEPATSGAPESKSPPQRRSPGIDLDCVTLSADFDAPLAEFDL